jgi:hypothetical protein
LIAFPFFLFNVGPLGERVAFEARAAHDCHIDVMLSGPDLYINVPCLCGSLFRINIYAEVRLLLVHQRVESAHWIFNVKSYLSVRAFYLPEQFVARAIKTHFVVTL